MIYAIKPHTIRETLKVAVSFLSANNVQAAQNDAYVLLQHIFKVDKQQLLFLMEKPIDETALMLYQEYLLKRCQGYPLQYLTGKQEFMSLNFEVTPAVLIPRSETELLVEKTIELLKTFQNTPKVVDVCTGSGCIIISICYYVKKGIFFATDISLEALRVAKKNASNIGLEKEISFFNADLLDNSAFAFSDIIVSNPPYIARNQIPLLQPEVSCYEPKLALDGGEDGLDIYRHLVPQAFGCLKNNGWFLVEIGCDQGDSVRSLFEANDFKEVNVYQDYSGKDRIVVGRR